MKFFSLTLLLALSAIFGFSQKIATIKHEKDSLFIVYDHATIFSGKISATGSAYIVQHQNETLNGCTYQVITIHNMDMKPVQLSGRIAGSEQSIACESEPADGLIKVVRHVVGRSTSPLNNAVYEREKDWLLSVDKFYPKVRITPLDKGYELNVSGWEIVIRFRPQYYQKHRGLSYFDPAKYKVWKKPVVGWCSWFAYFDQVNEQEVKETADVISDKLKPFGLEYLQIDDGYQQLPIGLPNTWLHTNKKFPSGLKNLAAYISSKGLTPGIWTNVSFADSAAAFKNKALFVHDRKGNPAFGNWVGYVMDGSNPQTIQQLIRPVYKGLNDDGFNYFKLDAIRHLKYEGYNSFKDYFAGKGTDRNEAFRNVAKEVRKQAGNNKFLLACWGIRPELVGIADGCRIGNDGYSYAGLAQYNSYNNIIWRNDPDHIVLSNQDAYRSCTATSLTGSLFMLTDKPDKYRNSPLIEAARRSIPVLYTQPGQVYDVDPSRSALINQADLEMSGSGPRPFDATSTTTTGLFELEINKPFENWVVLGRVDERDKVLPFKELGLDDKKEYLVFEFWTKKFEGIFNGRFIPGNIDTSFNCQVYCFREKQAHPQLLATNRHISCGGLELKNVEWKNNTLQGTSEVVSNNEYIIYIYEDNKFNFNNISVKNVRIVSNKKEGDIRMISLLSKSSGLVDWAVQYK
ncbi:MAG: glycoside hydrolase family 36 protein [Mucilaginibacter sp.]